MNAYLIDPSSKTVIEIEIGPGIQPIYDAIDCSCFGIATMRTDSVYVDDMGLLTGKGESVGLFTLPGLPAPLAGKGLVLSHDQQSESVPPKRPLSYYQENVEFLSTGSPEPRFDIYTL